MSVFKKQFVMPEVPDSRTPYERWLDGDMSFKDYAAWEAANQPSPEEVRTARIEFFRNHLRPIGELDVMDSSIDRMILDRGSGDGMVTGVITIGEDGLIDMETIRKEGKFDSGVYIIDAIYRCADYNYDHLTIDEVRTVFSILNEKFQGRFTFSVGDTVTSGQCIISVAIVVPGVD